LLDRDEMVFGFALLTKPRFNDPYTAMNIIQLGYIGNRSIVFHDASSARIACASLVKVEKADECDDS
jgi:hypothetical protein